MKEIISSGGCDAITKDAVYKDVVVVGNGPSGIALSFMLAGNWPYWNVDELRLHPDELLRARLNCAGSDESLVQQDLEMLADGLEGRSTNPVSLLLDSLQNPGADIGMTLPSMLTYRFHADKQVDHVVLGKGSPGGSWHRMDPNLRTLSLANWMSLPGYDFNNWEATHPTHSPLSITSHHQPSPIPEHRHSSDSPNNTNPNKCALIKSHTQKQCRLCTDADTSDRSQVRAPRSHPHRTNPQQTAPPHSDSMKTAPKSCNDNLVGFDLNNNGIKSKSAELPSKVFQLPRRNLAIQRQVSKEVQTRALVSRVAEYYESFVQEMNLSKHFAKNTVVSSVQPIPYAGAQRCQSVRWIVRGHCGDTGKPFTYICRNVVLAVGASDLPNRLGIRGESFGLPWIMHELPKLEVVLERLSQRERTKMKPVLIIGAGLSAADAVTICRSSNVHVIHVYRNSSVGLDKMLPEAVYPEYHAVHKMMKDSARPHDLYTPLAEHTLVDVTSESNEINSSRFVTLLNHKTGTTSRYEVSYCVVLIGSRPDLRLLDKIAHPSRFCTTTPIHPNLQHHLLIQKACTKEDNSVIFEHLTGFNMVDGVPNEKSDVHKEHWLLGRKMAWLKNICFKCRSVNMCEWSRRNDYRKICGQYSENSCIQTKAMLIKPVEQSTLAQEANNSDNVSLQLGEDPTKPIDCKTNPIAVNKFTNEVRHTARGLYAMGPLVGDNFVRFISGGALAITSALHRENY